MNLVLVKLYQASWFLLLLSIMVQHNRYFSPQVYFVCQELCVMDRNLVGFILITFISYKSTLIILKSMSIVLIIYKCVLNNNILNILNTQNFIKITKKNCNYFSVVQFDNQNSKKSGSNYRCRGFLLFYTMYKKY